MNDTPGSRDGQTAADHDEPYLWGHRATTDDFWPFTEMSFARLLVMRSKVREGLKHQGDTAADPPEPQKEPLALPSPTEESPS